MRIAFYAPLKSPTHGTPSGDRRVAGLYMNALCAAGHHVELVSTFRSYDREGDPARQAGLREQGVALGKRLGEQWRAGAPAARPELWFTYHSYYKAPDWLGPAAAGVLGIPYVVAEASHAGKRAGGPWDIGHRGALAAIERADLLLCPTRDDADGLRAVAADAARVVWMPPFLDSAPFGEAARERAALRDRFAAQFRLDAGVPWLAVAAMMRDGDKLASYRALADALARLRDLPWRLLIAGDGDARPQVAEALEAAAPGRAVFLGAVGMREIAALYAASDLCVWPAVNEAYGMAMLEAEAAGLPVVSCATRGVPDVVEHQRTGWLVPPSDAAAFADAVRALLSDPGLRAALGAAAARLAGGERSLEAASVRLQELLAAVRASGDGR